MKVSIKDAETAVELALDDVIGPQRRTVYYSDAPKLEAWEKRNSEGILSFIVIDGTASVLESFALHLSIILSGDAYSPGGEGIPTVVDVQDILAIRKEILNLSSVYEGDTEDGTPDTFDIWFDIA